MVSTKKKLRKEQSTNEKQKDKEGSDKTRTKAPTFVPRRSTTDKVSYPSNPPKKKDDVTSAEQIRETEVKSASEPATPMKGSHSAFTKAHSDKVLYRPRTSYSFPI